MSKLNEALDELEALSLPGKREAVVRAPEKVKMEWSEEQKRIICSSEPLIDVEALAGTGKTAVLLEFAKQKSKVRWKYVTYNRALSDAVQKDLPKNVKGSTFHAFAYSRFGQPLSSKMNRRFSPEAVRLLVGWRAFPGWEMAVAALREWRKGFMYSADDYPYLSQLPPKAWIWLVKQEHVLHEIGGSDGFMRAAETLWQATINPRSEMIDTPPDALVKLMTLMNGNWGSSGLLIDEAQDLSANIIDALNKQQIPQIRVGDPSQDLYAWRGGKKPWAENVSNHEYALTRSWRFGPQVAELANQVLAKLGRTPRLVGNSDKMGSVSSGFKWSAGMTWIARTQGGAIEGAMDALRNGFIPAWIGQGTLSRIESIIDLNNGKAPSDPWLSGVKNVDQLEKIAEETGSNEWKSGLRILKKFNEKELVEVLRTLNNPSRESVFVTTVHQAKGRTFEKAVLGSDLRWDLDTPEEMRLHYVALTRSPHVSFMSGGMDMFKHLYGNAEVSKSMAEPLEDEDGF